MKEEFDEEEFIDELHDFLAEKFEEFHEDACIFWSDADECFLIDIADKRFYVKYGQKRSY
jgi:CRISPR/Cas system endoribonuclease Cas6 (RAMP superfamily)